MTAENKIEPALRVLIVDDDRDDLAMLGNSLRALSGGGWSIHEAAEMPEALQAVRTGKIQIVVVAVNSPTLDVPLLLGSFGRDKSRFKTVVVAAAPTPELRAASLAGGADMFFEKPVSPEGLKAVFIGVSELAGWTPPEKSGVARGVALADIVQMECQARNSSVLELFHEQSLGRIYVEEGQVIHAVCGEISGERAFQKLLALAVGTFELHDFEPPAERTVNRTWEFLLAEAAREQALRQARAAAGQAVSVGEEAAAAAPAGRTAELLVCSAAGEILYAWQCADPAARVALLQAAAQRAEQLIPRIQMGKTDRLEIELPDGRAVLQVRADRLIFVRVANPEAKHEG